MKYNNHTDPKINMKKVRNVDLGLENNLDVDSSSSSSVSSPFIASFAKSAPTNIPNRIDKTSVNLKIPFLQLNELSSRTLLSSVSSE